LLTAKDAKNAKLADTLPFGFFEYIKPCQRNHHLNPAGNPRALAITQEPDPSPQTLGDLGVLCGEIPFNS